MLISGAITALVTPFKNDKIDEENFRKFIDWQIAEGIHGLSPCGTTGESATLSHDELERVIELCIEQVGGRVPVLAGSGSNNTSEAIRLTRFAQKAGATAALLITPYYNKPTQQGLYEHYSAIAKAVELPLVPYNVPSRTGCNMLPPVLAKLAREFPHIIGVKEATGDMAQASRVIESCPESFLVISGDDLSALPLLAIGGHGVLSVTSNLAPARVSAMINAFRSGNLAEARRIHHGLFPLNEAMFAISNPIPVKTALSLMGMMSSEMRLPLCQMTGEDKEKLAALLRQQQLI